MLLTIDIGNSSVVVGAFGEGEVPVASWRLPTDRRGQPEEIRRSLEELWRESGLGGEDFGAAALCSVVGPLTEVWRGLLAETLEREPLVLHQRMDLGLALDVESPDAVGMDRLADAVAVRARAEGAAVAIDFGTATTFNVVDEEGRFRGGAIAPGLSAAAGSLLDRAPGLLELAPDVAAAARGKGGAELEAPSSAIGRDTDGALRSGIILGYTGLVEGLLGRIRKELAAPVTVIATGGAGRIITSLTGAIDQYDPWLTLAGIRRIYQLNSTRG